MASLFDQLSDKIDEDPRVTKRGGARFDLTLLLFNARHAIRDLWLAADRVASGDQSALGDLRSALDELRPIFDESGHTGG